MPFAIVDEVALKAKILEIGERDLPDYVPDYTNPDNAKLNTTKNEININAIQDNLYWANMDEFQRQMRDPADINEHLKEVIRGFSVKRTTIGDAGSAEPAVSGWATTTRATLSGQTALDTTSFDGWIKLISGLESKMRSSMNSAPLYNSVPKWLRMTNDVYTNAESVTDATNKTLTVLDWLKSKYSLITFTDGLSATLDKSGNIGTAGVETIMLGTNSPETGIILQTPFKRVDKSRHTDEVRWDFRQKFVPVTLRKAGFIYQTGLTV